MTLPIQCYAIQRIRSNINYKHIHKTYRITETNHGAKCSVLIWPVEVNLIQCFQPYHMEAQDPNQGCPITEPITNLPYYIKDIGDT